MDFRLLEVSCSTWKGIHLKQLCVPSAGTPGVSTFLAQGSPLRFCFRDSVTLEYVFQVTLWIYRRNWLLGTGHEMEWDDMKWDEISPYSMPRSTPYRDCQRTGHWPLGCRFLVFCKQTRFCHMFRRILWQTFALLWHQSPWELIGVGLWSSHIHYLDSWVHKARWAMGCASGMRMCARRVWKVNV